MPAIAFGSDPDVLVDLLDERRLALIFGAVQEALTKDPARIWPAALAAGPIDLRAAAHAAAAFEPKLMLVPLDRLGGQQGFSGSDVLIGYCTDLSGTYRPSMPLVIKVGPFDALNREFEDASKWPRHPTGDDSRFARPFLLHPVSGGVLQEAVLVAPFSSENALDGGRSVWKLHLKDIWKLLHTTPGSQSELHGALTSVFTLMSAAHSQGRVKCEADDRNLVQEYRWYLRDLDREPHAEIPRTIFGTESTCRLDDVEFPNPVLTLQRLIAEDPRASLCVGAVHGDLHPKNVVLDGHLVPNVIDFGWATTSAHVVRDYVLMDINLRTMTLPSQVSPLQFAAMSQVLTPSDDSPSLAGECLLRLQLIRSALWGTLEDNGLVDDWEMEYVVPMFVVSYGLLKHLDHARNQNAHLRLVTALSQRVDGILSRRGA